MVRNATTIRLMTGTALILLTGLVYGCASPRDDPRLSAEELYTPTPIPSDATGTEPATPADPGSGTEPADIFGFDYNGKVSLAQWDNPAIQMENFIVGYIIVHGMVYEIELVEIVEDDYAAALESGEVDAVLEVTRSKSTPAFEQLLESGEVIDVGSLFGESSDVRIGARAQLKQTAPPVYDLLTKVETDEEILAGYAARIRAGRVGVTAKVAGMIFLKQHEDIWTSWVSTETADSVKAAIEDGKAGLKYKCLPVRGETVKHCK